jgi:hypothetical protein
MKSPQNLNGDDLELILFQNIKDRRKKKRFLAKLKQIIVSFSKEPEAKVGKVKDNLGNTIWCVYDPITGQSARLTSEVEVGLWLKERYYQVNDQVR